MMDVVAKVVMREEGGKHCFFIKTTETKVHLVDVNSIVYKDFKGKVDEFVKDLVMSISEYGFKMAGEENIAISIIKPSELN